MHTRSGLTGYVSLALSPDYRFSNSLDEASVCLPLHSIDQSRIAAKQPHSSDFSLDRQCTSLALCGERHFVWFLPTLIKWGSVITPPMTLGCIGIKSSCLQVCAGQICLDVTRTAASLANNVLTSMSIRDWKPRQVALHKPQWKDLMSLMCSMSTTASRGSEL